MLVIDQLLGNSPLQTSLGGLMKSALYNLSPEYGYKLVKRETESVLKAKMLADALVRKIFLTPVAHWVNERETYICDNNFKVYPNGDQTGEFSREFVILGHVQINASPKQIEVYISMDHNSTYTGGGWGDFERAQLHEIFASEVITSRAVFKKNDDLVLDQWQTSRCR